MNTNGYKCDALPGLLYETEDEVLEALVDVYGPLSCEFEAATIAEYFEDDGFTSSNAPTKASGVVGQLGCEVAGLYAAIEHLPLTRVLELAQLTPLAA